MPCLLPPPEFKPGELESMGLTGTCEMQVVRSAGPWSLGTPDRIEHSIQNAYLKGRFYPIVPGLNVQVVGPFRSDSTLRTFCVHREPVFHHLVSPARFRMAPLPSLRPRDSSLRFAHFPGGVLGLL